MLEYLYELEQLLELQALRIFVHIWSCLILYTYSQVIDSLERDGRHNIDIIGDVGRRETIEVDDTVTH